MINKLISMAFLGLAMFCGAALAEDPPVSPDMIPGTHRVDAEDLIRLANEIPDLRIIDARVANDRAQGYIEGSVNLPDIDTDCDTLTLHIESLTQPVLFYCNGIKCGRSVKSARKAIDCGYQTVYWFRGGYEEWLAKGYPVIKD